MSGMRYTLLGRSGLMASRIALGTATFGVGSGPYHRLDQVGADGLVSLALDRGVNMFNSADVYNQGQSEEILGRALGKRRHDAIIATKVGGQTGSTAFHRGLSRRHILSAVDASLRRLGTDYIDLYGPHRVDPNTPIEETLEALDSVVRAGKVRYLGASNWPSWQMAKAVALQERNGWHRFCASESYYSLLGRDVEHELIPCLIDAGVDLVVWSPLAMGYLTGRFSARDRSGEGRIASIEDPPPVDPDHAEAVIATVRRIAGDHHLTPAQVSLAWLLSRRQVGSILLGASSAEQFTENLAALDVVLSADALDELDQVSRPAIMYPAWHWHQVQKLGTEPFPVDRPAWVRAVDP
jgi:aryl-alcohol dehydrogenase-like predicted oxidoreductase